MNNTQFILRVLFLCLLMLLVVLAVNCLARSCHGAGPSHLFRPWMDGMTYMGGDTWGPPTAHPLYLPPRAFDQSSGHPIPLVQVPVTRKAVSPVEVVDSQITYEQ